MISHSKPWITETDRRAVDQVLASGMIAQGTVVGDFEAKVAGYLGLSGGVAVSSGTAALTLALRALGVTSQSEVIAPTYVCKNVVDAILCTGAKPVLCDVGEEWNMTAATVAPKVTTRTAAIIVVHVFGIPTDTHAFGQLGVPIIEDACQALGTRLKGAYVGSLGTVGVFSFHATKCLTTGEGGMVVSNDTTLLARMRELRNGTSSVSSGRLTSPLTDVQASLGLSQLARYPQFLARRQEIAELYFSELRTCRMQLPVALQGRSVFFRFPVRVRGNLDRYQARFIELGIHVRRGVDTPLHRILGLDARSFPVAETLFAETLSLPIYPALQDQDLEKLLAAYRAVFESHEPPH
jgi:perosamine synthetase